MSTFKIVTSPPKFLGEKKHVTLRVFDGPDADHLGLTGTLIMEPSVADEFLALLPRSIIVEWRGKP